MKQTIFTIIIVVVVTFLLFNFFGPHKKFDTKPYEVKIDSLQKEINYVLVQNDSLTQKEGELESYNLQLVDQTLDLKHTITNLKNDSSHIKIVYAYTPTQVDSFFSTRYVKAYKEHSTDTTHLPLPVAKAAVIDILELDKTKNVLAKTDSLVEVQSQLINGKDQVITVLKTKETNYQSVISLQLKQQDNYKAQIVGLKDDIKRSSRSVKMQKVKTFVLGAAVIALAATHK